MTLFLVKNEQDRPVWIAHVVDDDYGWLYVYVPNTRRFHFNRGLTRDFYVDREMTYRPITEQEAADLLSRGEVGRLDPKIKGPLLQQFREDSDPLPVERVLSLPEA